MEPQLENLTELAEDVVEHVDEIEQDTDGLEWYVVGGAVRDTVIPGRSPNDFDFVVVGETMESMVERGFQNIQSSSFPVLIDEVGEEWALARTEQKQGVGYHGFDVETEDVSIFDDVIRRDLGVNAMFLGPDAYIRNECEVLGVGDLDSSDGVVIHNDTAPTPSFHETGVDGIRMFDPHSGLYGIEDEVLTPVSTNFKDDPVRVLRLARFSARLGFNPSDVAIEYSRDVAYELSLVAKERIGDEVVKAQKQAESPRRFWEVLRDTGALAVIFPELHQQTVTKPGPWVYHAEGWGEDSEQLFEHTMMVVDRMYEICERENITGDARARRLLMAVAHDCGKSILNFG